jgi:hypothetical protein
MGMVLVSWPGGDWQTTAKIAVALLIIYLGAIWLTLIFWTYRDIRQRSRDPVLQTVAVLLVLVFFLPGHWIYLIVRPRHTLTELYERSLEEEALLQELEDQKGCPTCKRRVHDEYLVCPSCRTQLKEPCRSCQKPLSYAWLACPYCGLEKAPRENIGARPVRPAAGRPPAPPVRPQQRPPSALASAGGSAQPQRVTRPNPNAGSRDPFAPRTAPHSASDDAPVIGE